MSGRRRKARELGHPHLARAVLSGVAALGVVWLIALGSPAGSVASCTSYHSNVMGYDAGAEHYGNAANIYVNTSSTLGNLQSAVFRSLFVSGPYGDDVEVGWTANNGGHYSPTVYAEWINRGVDSGPRFYTGYSLNYNTNYQFKVQNFYHDEVFAFYVDGQGSAFNSSPTMQFDQGWILTNSEHYNSCDSMWTHMYALYRFNYYGQWIASYQDLAEWVCTSNGNWLLNIISNSELYVDQSGGGC